MAGNTLLDRPTADDLAVPHLAFKAGQVTLGVDKPQGVVTAIVSVTGVVDEVNDLIVPGAYTKTLLKRRPKVCDGHDWAKPIGRVIRAEEWLPGDERLPAQTKDGQPWPAAAGALVCVMQFNMKTDRGRQAFEDVAFYSATDEAEWSIGYQPAKATKDPRTGVRKLHEVDLYTTDPVLFGAAPLSMTLDVKDAASGADLHLKRKFSMPDRQQAAGAGAAMPDGSFPIESADDLANAIQAVGRAADPAAAKQHIIKRARALGLLDKLPDGWVKASSAKQALVDVTETKDALLLDGRARDTTAGDGAGAAPADEDGSDKPPGDAGTAPNDTVSQDDDEDDDGDVAGPDVADDGPDDGPDADTVSDTVTGDLERLADALADTDDDPDEDLVAEGKALAPEWKYDTSPVGTPGGPQNWVDKVGGLPAFIRAVAHALVRAGKSESAAIRIAVGRIRDWAEGKGNVSAKTRAKAAATIAEWERKRAQAHADTGKAAAYDPRLDVPPVAVKTVVGMPDPVEEALDYKSFPNLPGTVEEQLEDVRAAVRAKLGPDRYNSPNVVGASPGPNPNGWDYIDINGTYQDRVIATRVRWSGIDGGDIRETYEIPYSIAADGTVSLGGLEPVVLTVVPIGAGEDTALDVPPLGDLLPLDSMVGAATSAIKAAHALTPMESKSGRVLSGANAARLRTAIEHLLAVVRGAGIDINTAAGTSERKPGDTPPERDTTAPPQPGMPDAEVKAHPAQGGEVSAPMTPEEAAALVAANREFLATR